MADKRTFQCGGKKSPQKTSQPLRYHTTVSLRGSLGALWGRFLISSPYPGRWAMNRHQNGLQPICHSVVWCLFPQPSVPAGTSLSDLLEGWWWWWWWLLLCFSLAQLKGIYTSVANQSFQIRTIKLSQQTHKQSHTDTSQFCGWECFLQSWITSSVPLTVHCHNCWLTTKKMKRHFTKVLSVV